MEPHLFLMQEAKRHMERTIKYAKEHGYDTVIFENDEDVIILTGMVRQWFPNYKVSKNEKNEITISWKNSSS